MNDIYESLTQEISAFNDRLREKYAVDAAHVFVTWTEQGNTCAMDRGVGNYYTQKGMVVSWLEKQCEPRINPETVRIEDDK